MPVKMNFLEDGLGVEFVSSGVVTGEEIIAANKELYTRTNLLRLRYKIIDRTACTDYRVTSKDIEKIAEQDRRAAQINRDLTIALVAPNDLQFGMTRMWQGYVADLALDSQIFPSRDEADAYLRKKFTGTAR